MHEEKKVATRMAFLAFPLAAVLCSWQPHRIQKAKYIIYNVESSFYSDIEIGKGVDIDAPEEDFDVNKMKTKKGYPWLRD